jgi:ABC-type Fe3+ transport system substrate-binding protein
LQELADPKYKGLIAMDYPANVAAAYFMLSCQRLAWGDTKWKQWLQGLKDNEVFLTSNATSAYQAVVSGQRLIAPDNVDDVQSQAPGTPVKLAFYPGVPTQIFNNYLIKGGSHPYTAQLFANWCQSEAGQKVIASTGRSPVLDIDSPESVSHILPPGTTVCSQQQTEDMNNNQDSYLSVYNTLWQS